MEHLNNNNTDSNWNKQSNSDFVKRYCDTLISLIHIGIIQKQAALHTKNIIAKVVGDQIFVDREAESSLGIELNTDVRLRKCDI